MTTTHTTPPRAGGRAGARAETADLAALLHETSERHGAYEPLAPAHDWWDFYAAYLAARMNGRTPDAASRLAVQYMADVKHVVVPPTPTSGPQQ